MANCRRWGVLHRLRELACPSRIIIRAFSWSIIVALMLSSMLSGCSPIYFLRAAYEEGRILWRRQPITDFLATPDLHNDTKEKLTTVLAVRDYAQNVLNLNVAGSYASYSYVDRPDLTYVVIAAPQTELRPYTWWFLVVGHVPYKGFFSKSEAQSEAERLHKQGYDTTIRTSAAFSTLGWFDDPLLSHLLRFDKIALSEVVFHELFHNTLYIKGAGAFNESAANFIGHRATIDFFGQRFGDESAEHRRAVQLWQEELEFAEFIEDLIIDLSGLYRRNIAKQDKLRLRNEVFARSQSEWARRIAARPAHRFRGFSQQPLNNAVLMHYGVYLNNLQLFESLYELEGRNLVRTIAALERSTQNGGEPFGALRSWLNKHKIGALEQAG
jgi:predicted aminopeptidase